MFAMLAVNKKQRLRLDFGESSKIDNQNGKYKLPHIGWNQLILLGKVKFSKYENNSHMYFVHSYEFIPKDKNVIQQLLIIHLMWFVQWKKKIYLVPNFTQRKVIKSDLK